MKGHLSESGYNPKSHEERINSLRDKGLTIKDAIEAVVSIYEELYEQDAYDINCGNCEEFAHDIIDIINNGKESKELFACWHDEQPDCNEDEAFLWGHKFICYKGRYYDSQSPSGVDTWRELSCFKNSQINFEEKEITLTKEQANALDEAMSKEPVKVKTRELPSRLDYA